MPALTVQSRARRAPAADPGLERLHFAVEGHACRLRLAFLGIDLSDRDRVLRWLEDGARVDDVDGYRRFLAARRARLDRGDDGF